MKFNGLLLLPVALILIIAITSKPTKPRYDGHTSIISASLEDSLPLSFLQQVNPHEIQGYRVSKGFHENTFYFEYTANHNQVLKALATLPFAVDSVRADVQCRVISEQSELKQLERLLLQEGIAKTFQVNEPLSHYTLYQCLKTPQQHYVLLNKGTDKVLHIIQQV